MTINLSEIARQKEWHLASIISALQKQSLSRQDAEAYANFIFADEAETNDGRPEDHLSDEQWARLNIIKQDWILNKEA